MLGMSRSIFRRLLYGYLVTVLLGLGLSGILLSFFAKEHIYNEQEEELLRKAKKVNAAIQHSDHVSKDMIELLVFLDETFDTRIWVFDRDGKIVATSMQDEVYTGKSIASSIAQRVTQGQVAITELKLEGMEDPMLSVSVPWGEGNQVYGGIVLHAPIKGIERTFAQMREAILWATLFGILLSTAMVSYLSWTISRPLSQIERTAAEIGRGNYGVRVWVNSNDEVGDLAKTINTLAAKLDEVEQERRHLEQVRNDFLANVSHELRTPLTAMQGFLEALQDGLIEEEEARQKYYAILYNETIQASRLVDDLMDLMKLENKEITLAKIPVDVGEMLHKLAFMFQPEALERGTRIDVQISSDLPKVFADKDRLAQIFKNLLKNAVKFTEQGTITLRAEAAGKQVKMMVQDTGIGIAEEDLKRIWERFFKVDRGRSKKNQGTGLGLAIVKELVQMHEGRIEVSSQPGVGTTFTVWLPTVDSYRQKMTAGGARS